MPSFEQLRARTCVEMACTPEQRGTYKPKCRMQKAENERVAAEMQDIQAEQKRLGNETKAKERAHRQATQAVQQARNALENKTAELDGARSTEEDLLQQHMQSTQVTHPSACHVEHAASWIGSPFCMVLFLLYIRQFCLWRQSISDLYASPQVKYLHSLCAWNWSVAGLCCTAVALLTIAA